MAITSRGEGGVGGGGRGMMNTGFGKIKKSISKKPKPAPKPKVSLAPEPSSVKMIPKKGFTWDGPAEAAAANTRIYKAQTRTNPATAKVEKRALKAANKPIKSTADSARAQAQAASNNRAIKAMEKRLKELKALKPGQAAPKKLTTEQKFAYRRSMDYGPEGVMTKQAKKSIKQQKAINKLYK